MRVFEGVGKAIRRPGIKAQTRRRWKQENVPSSVEKVYPDESYVHFSLYK